MASLYFDGNKLRIYEVPTSSTYTVDGNGYRIYTPTGTPEAIVRFNVQKDLWSRFQDWVYINSWSYLAFNRSGGNFRGYDPLGNALYQTNDYQLRVSVGWKIVLANYPHQTIFQGNLFADDGTENLFDTARITAQGVVGRIQGSDSLLTYQVATGGVTPAQVWSYSDRSLTDKTGFALSSAGVRAIWEFVLTNASSVSGSAGRALERIAKVLGVGNTSVIASNTGRSTGDGSISQTITDNGDGSKTMSGSP